MLDDAIRKALSKSSVTTGQIGDFLPVAYAEEFAKLLREKNWLRGLLRSIVMPAATMNIPKLTGDAAVYYVSSQISAPSAQSQPAFADTGSVQLVAKKLMAYVDVANEVDEDSKIALMPLIKESFAEGMATAEEKAFLLGGLFAYSAAQDPRNAFNGLVTDAGKSQAADNNDLIKTIELARFQLSKYGRDVRELVILVNPYTGSVLRRLEEVITIEKYGAKATILNGELGQIMGIKIIEHALLPEDPTAENTIDDFATNGSATKGIALLLKRDAAIIGDRRKIKFDQDKVVEKDATRVVISERIGFETVHANAICKITGLTNSKG